MFRLGAFASVEQEMPVICCVVHCSASVSSKMIPADHPFTILGDASSSGLQLSLVRTEPVVALLAAVYQSIVVRSKLPRLNVAGELDAA